MLICFLICAISSAYGFDLTITHTNDVHARIEQINKYGSACNDDAAAEGKCYGGVARLFTKLEEIRSAKQNVIHLNAGDSFQGTLWYFYYQGLATAHFTNKLGIDVVSLGNHEFDDGPAVLRTFLQNITYPVVACNVDSSNEPLIQGLYLPSVTLDVSGTKIGVVGYLTPDTKILVPPEYVENVVFNDEVECIQEEVNKFKAQGIDIIIALGHSGFNMDLKIAAEVDGIDVVVGGHSNTFLYTGEPPSNEDPVGPYPYVVEQESGRNVLVVQAFAYGKYLGYLDVTFDDDGEVDYYEGNPILLDSSVAQDPDILADVMVWREPIRELQMQVVGKTFVELQGMREMCRMTECNLGNLVTDAIMYVHQTGPKEKDEPWTNTAIAMWNGGGIRTSLDQGDLTVGQILTVLPFRNEIIEVTLKGKHLLEILEHSVSEYDPTGADAPGGFLQMSGLRVTYNINKPVGERVVEVYVRCADCTVPKFEPLDEDKVYGILTSSFLYTGGDGYDMIAPNAITNIPYGTICADAVRDYIEQFSPIIHGEEGRITVLTEEVITTTAPYPPINKAAQLVPLYIWYIASIIILLTPFLL